METKSFSFLRLILYFFILLLFISCQSSYTLDTSFTEKSTSIKYAKGFKIINESGYKKVLIINPKDTGEVLHQYILVSEGTELPFAEENTTIVNVPIQRVISFSSSYVAFMKELQELNKLIGVSDVDYIYDSSIQNLLEKNTIADVGTNLHPNLEKIVTLEPDVILRYGGQGQSQQKFNTLNIPTLFGYEYMEMHPLGRAEWIKWVAVFFDLEKQADSLFTIIEKQYTTIQKKAEIANKVPTILTGIRYGDAWYVPGGNSFVARLLKDANANYIWKDNTETGNLPIDFEVVFQKGQYADYWINVGEVTSLEELSSIDPRYNLFKAFNTQQIYNNNNRVIPSGGNDYWESGVLRPHIVLKDLVHIFHPHLFPNYNPYYYKRVTTP